MNTFTLLALIGLVSAEKLDVSYNVTKIADFV